METLRDHSPSQERHHRRHRNDHARHERHGENGGSSRHSPSPSLDPQRERRSDRSRDYSSPSSSSSSRRRQHSSNNFDEPHSSGRSSPAAPQNQQLMHDQEVEQEQSHIAELEMHPEESQQQPPLAVENRSSLDLVNSTSIAQPTDLIPSEARATSESTPTPLLSSTLQIEKHKSKRDSQEQHRKTEAKEDAKIQELKATILELERQEQEIIKSIRGEGSPNEIIDQRIRLLHEYNEIKDVGQIILGKCAEIEGTTIKSQYEKYGLDTDD
ncbi:DNA repair protein Swi5/Sae3 [Entomortierella parvispora]|uniref:DNA repair protein Swi5/Sae3 n=1 Tax=Entomortierella parvispora TaxID=205924 RepID=A0A9P3HKM3_9FUNG|nr:DNA repair protein Swi5/Sae3 [Entomortierella parvispora]